MSMCNYRTLDNDFVLIYGLCSIVTKQYMYMFINKHMYIHTYILFYNMCEYFLIIILSTYNV